MASKKTHAVSLKGEFDLDSMEIVEMAKEGEFTYDFLEILREFDGKNVAISIKEDTELPVKDQE
jgi:hypothetical protein